MQTEQIESFVINRLFRATPEKVFHAWTDPSFVSQWFRPNDRWVKCEAEIEPKVGGKFHLIITHQDGDVFKMLGNIAELVPNEKLALNWVDFMDSDSIVAETLVTIELRPVEGGTELNLTHSKLPSLDMKAGVTEGWAGCLASLEKYV